MSFNRYTVYYWGLNFHSDPRSFHVLFDEVANYLKNSKGADLVNEKFSILRNNDIEYKIYDCELLIHDKQNDSYKGLSFADNHTPFMSFLMSRNNLKDLVVCSQVHTTALPHHQLNLRWKYSIYTPAFPNLGLEDLYKKRLSNPNYIDKLLFRGNVIPENRTSAMLLKNYSDFEGYDYVESYFDDLTKFKVGLSIPGVGELCFRDVEYMAVGIPMLRFKYVGNFNPELIPNYHYISIDRIDTPDDFKSNGGVIASERTGGQRYVDAYIKRFEEVRNDTEFLNFISKNARKYYEDYLHPNTRLRHVLNLLEID